LLLREPGTGRWVVTSPEVTRGWRVEGEIPPPYPEWLGDRSFAAAHGTRFTYVAGSMANGIASPALVAAVALTAGLGFFGAAGLAYSRIEAGWTHSPSCSSPGNPGAPTLIHAPNEPKLEARTAALYPARGVRFVEVSAFMDLTPTVVHVACAGVRAGPDGSPSRPRAILAKVSRTEVARRFLSPAPPGLLQPLVAQGQPHRG